jgi:hypothetical protein
VTQTFVWQRACVDMEQIVQTAKPALSGCEAKTRRAPIRYSPTASATLATDDRPTSETRIERRDE